MNVTFSRRQAYEKIAACESKSIRERDWEGQDKTSKPAETPTGRELIRKGTGDRRGARKSSLHRGFYYIQHGKCDNAFGREVGRDLGALGGRERFRGVRIVTIVCLGASERRVLRRAARCSLQHL